MIIGIVDILLQLALIISTAVDLSKGTTTSGSGATSIVGGVLSVIAASFLILGVMKVGFGEVNSLVKSEAQKIFSKQDKAGYLLFWIVLKGIALTIYVITFILFIIAVIAVGANGASGAGVGVIIFAIILIGCIICEFLYLNFLNLFDFQIFSFLIVLNAYWWAVVRSYREELMGTLPR